MKPERSINIPEIFKEITKTEPPVGFGEPFATAFAQVHYTGNHKEITVASFICSLFLSAILEAFPTDKLHTFVHYTRENCSRFTFDCRMYDTLMERITDNSLMRVILLDKHGKAKTRECSREDIREAFDFYTNR